MKLTACLIVKNEKDHIETVLKSLKGVDEIVVVDTGSEDNTVDLARKYTDKVFSDYKWNDDFAEARNHALSKCTGDWVLSIDADEFLEDNGVEKIRKLIAEAGEKKTFMVRMKSGNNYHPLARIFINDGTVKWRGAIHETLMPVERNETDVVITYGYSTAHEKDPDRSFRILVDQVNKHPESPREKYYLAREFFYRKSWIAAIWFFNEYIKQSTWDAEKADAYLYSARCLFNMQKGNEAREACLRAIQINPDFKEALYFMSDLHYEPYKSKWAKIAAQATNRDVLFIRTTNREIKPLDMSEMDILHFKNVLMSYKNPRILEWGSGNSTKYFTDFLQKQGVNYTWTALEHHEGWAKTVKGWNLKNVDVIFADKDSEAYLNPQGAFDVIFVDGRNRRRCVLKAKELLKPGGTVLLHDADREYYHSAFEGYSGRFVNPEFNGEPRLWEGKSEQKIPKIIHQIWIGDKEMPVEWMNTWRLPGFEYKLWTEKEIAELGLRNQHQYDLYYAEKCYNGCANIARTEILAKYGGIYIDADSKCLTDLSDAPFMSWDIFSVYEADNFWIEGKRLIANGIIGCVPQHPIILKYIEEQGKIVEINPSWRKSGPLLWTQVMTQDYSVLPPYTFLPTHHSGTKNQVTGTVYAEQFWGTSHNIYNNASGKR